MEHIAESTPELIRLDCSRDELAKMPVYDQVILMPYDLTGFTAGAYMVWPYYMAETPVIRREKEHIPANELAIRQRRRSRSLRWPRWPGG